MVVAIVVGEVGEPWFGGDMFEVSMARPWSFCVQMPTQIILFYRLYTHKTNSVLIHAHAEIPTGVVLLALVIVVTVVLINTSF